MAATASPPGSKAPSEPAILTFASLRDGTGRILDFRCIQANPAAISRFENGRGPLTGASLRQNLAPLTQGDLFGAYIDAVERGTAFARLENLSGCGSPGRTHLAVAKAGDGFVAILTDWLAPADTAAQLPESVLDNERLFRDLVEGSLQGIAILQRGRFVFANRMFAEIFGYASAEDILKLESTLDLIVPEAREWVLQSSQARLAGQPAPDRYRVGCVRRDGTRIMCEVMARVVLWRGEPAVQVTNVDVTERIHAEDALKTNNRLMMALLDAVPYHILVKDLAGRYALVNRAKAEFHGAAPQDLVGKTAAELRWANPHLRDATTAVEREVLETGAAQMMDQLEGIGTDGRPMVHRLLRVPLRDGEGKIEGTVGIALDITEEVAARRELELANERMQDAIRNFPGGISIWDSELRLVLCNETTKTFWPHVADQLVPGVRFEEVVRAAVHNELGLSGEERDQLAARMTASTTDSGSHEYPAGERTIQVLYNRTTRGGTICVMLDITETKRREQELSDQQRLLRQVFDSAPVRMTVKDPQGTYRMVNQAWQQYYGLAEKDVVGRKKQDIPVLRDVIAPWVDHADATVAIAHRAVEADGLLTRDVSGAVRWEHARKYPLLDERGNMAGIIGVAEDITARRDAEEALRRSQSLLKRAFDTIPYDLFIKDLEGRVLMANPAMARTWGRPVDELIGHSVREMSLRGPVPDDEHAQIVRTDAEVLATGAPIEYRLNRRHPDGMHQFRVVKAPVRDNDGSIFAFMVLAEEITADLQRELELHASQRLLRTVFDTIPHILTVKDLEGRYLMVNKAWSETFGVASEVALNRHPEEVMRLPDPGRERFREEDAAAIAHGATLRFDGKFLDGEGEPHDSQAIKTPLRDEDGHIVGVVGLFMDVTAERRMRHLTDLAHARLYDAMESMPGAFMLYDAQERLVLWNSKVRDFLPAAYERLQPGMRIDDVVRACAPEIADASEDMDQWVQQRVNQFRFNPQPYEQRLKDGRWVQGLDRRTSDGGTVCLRFDITPNKAQELDLRQAQKMEAIGQLTGGIAHDFNNLLTVILGNAEMLSAALNSPDLNRAARMIADAGLKASALTRRLLTFARRQQLEPVELRLNQVVSGMEGLIRRTIGEHIVVEVRSQPDLWRTLADPAQVDNALLNLAVNARDAMPHGGRLTISTANVHFERTHPGAIAGDFIALEVADTGTGMPKEIVARIFDPFFTTKEVGKGTGLGLSMVYGFVKQSGGHVTVDSEVGRGTTVRLYLPRYAGPDAQVPKGEAHDPGLPRGGESILLVEDDELVRVSTALQLRGLGYQVLEAAEGGAALEVLTSSQTVELLMTDVVIPGAIDGHELARRARALWPALRVLFTSGHADRLVPQGQHSDARTAFLHKPFLKSGLAHAVRRVLDA